MTGSDDEFEDFLKVRRLKFRPPDDMFEPPAELDRLVLRQAREAIETPRPLRVFRGPGWGTPVALAATLVLGFAVVFQAGTPPKNAPIPEVTVQNVAQRTDYPQAAAPMAPSPTAAASQRVREDADTSGTVTVDLTAPMVAKRDAASGRAPMTTSENVEAAASERAMSDASMETSAVVAAAPAAKSSEVPGFRRDPKTWLAEIERLRNAGDTALADAELAEYKRQQRAYAVGPDR